MSNEALARIDAELAKDDIDILTYKALQAARAEIVRLAALIPEPSTDDDREARIDDDWLHIYWFDEVEGCWVAFRRVDCVGEEELPAQTLARNRHRGPISEVAVEAARDVLEDHLQGFVSYATARAAIEAAESKR